MTVLTTENVTDIEHIGIIVPVVFGIIAFIGVFENVLVIVVVLSDKKMRSTTNILTMSLAVADLLFVIFRVPFKAIAYALPVWPFGVIWCKFVNYMMFVSAFGNVYTLVLMSLGRYMVVVHANHAMTIYTERNTYIIGIIIIWVIILLTNIPLILQYGQMDYEYGGDNRSSCINFPVYLSMSGTGEICSGFFFAFGYFIPLLIMCILYGLILKRLFRRVEQVGRLRAKERVTRKVTRMVLVVFGMFAGCWLPLHIIFLITRFGHRPNTVEFTAVTIASNCLAYMNSCVNPIIYAFLSDDFRKSYRKRLSCLYTHSRM